MKKGIEKAIKCIIHKHLNSLNNTFCKSLIVLQKKKRPQSKLGFQQVHKHFKLII